MTWVHLGKEADPYPRDSINYVNISTPPLRFVSIILTLLKLTIFCVKRRVSFVYVDEWLLFHGGPERILLLQLLLRVVKVKFVLDQRDPLLDFLVASKGIETGKSKRIRWLYLLIYRLADLTILPSSTYRDDIVAQGISSKKVLGIFRGIDLGNFNTSADGDSVRQSLGMERKFVVGWFGIMHRFRLIREVIVPLIENAETIPNAHFLIGGEGPLKDEFLKLKKNRPELPFTLVDFIPYRDLAKYIAACDVLLCPVDTRYRLTRLTLFLKVVESLATGRPVIVTRTPASLNTYGDLKGIIWVDEKLESFQKVLHNFRKEHSSYQQVATKQAQGLGGLSIAESIPRIVDRILKA